MTVDGSLLDGPSRPVLSTAFLPRAADVVVSQREAAAAMRAAGQPDPLSVAVRSYLASPSEELPRLVLLADACPFSNWVGARQVFTRLPLADRLRLLTESVYGLDPLFATHLEMSATVVTDDGVLVCRGSGDRVRGSAVSCLVTVCDFASRWNAAVMLAREACVQLGVNDSDWESLRVTTLAVRVRDGGLWVGGHGRLRLSSGQLRRRIVAARGAGADREFDWLPWHSAATVRQAVSSRNILPWAPAALVDLFGAAEADFDAPYPRRGFAV